MALRTILSGPALAESGHKCAAGMAALEGGTVELFLWGKSFRTTRLDAFCLDVTEVTAGAYKACVDAGACSAAGRGRYATYAVPGRELYPVNHVSWRQAREYCAWKDARLPTEEEWQWAAGGGAARTKFPWGDAPPEKQLCWCGEGNDRGVPAVTAKEYPFERDCKGPCAAGSYPAGDSPQGIKDLAGNVMEWTSSRPLQKDSPVRRVLRGGAFNAGGPSHVSADAAPDTYEQNADGTIGFRCARTVRP